MCGGSVFSLSFYGCNHASIVVFASIFKCLWQVSRIIFEIALYLLVHC